MSDVKYFLERLSEIRVEYRVDKGIDNGVDVAQPSSDQKCIHTGLDLR